MTPIAAIKLCISRLAAVGIPFVVRRGKPVSWGQYQRAVRMMSCFSAYVLMMVVVDAMRLRLERGDVLTADQLEEFSNQFGRMAHQAARDEAARK